MAAVNLLSGEVNRTWIYNDPETEREHIITLYHDTISGVRCAMLDYEEIPGSMGTTTILGGRGGTVLVFTVNRKTGFVRIGRAGLASFRYECVVNGQAIPESTAKVSLNDEERYAVEVREAVTTKSDSVHIIAWYQVETTRPSDGAATVVHRRFKDFANLDAEVRAALKGNHLAGSLPPLPPKQLKHLTAHSTPGFIDQRRRDLGGYLRRLIAMPHVPHMYQLHSFLGIVKAVREYSAVFRGADLGLQLGPTTQCESPVCVASVQDAALAAQVTPGDILSKVNGKPTSRSP